MKKSILICILFLSASVLFFYRAQAQENDTPKTVLVINAVVNQEHKQELQGYLSQMMQIFTDNGGKPLGRYKTIEKIKGSQAPEMIAIVSFEYVQLPPTLCIAHSGYSAGFQPRFSHRLWCSLTRIRPVVRYAPYNSPLDVI